MNERAWERIGAASGLLAAVLLLVSVLLVPVPPSGDEAILMLLFVGGYRESLVLAALLTTLAAVVSLWFVAHLRHLLQRAEGGAEAFSPVVFASGISLATMTMLSMLPVAALASLARRTGALSRATVLLLGELHKLALGGLGLLIALFAATAGAAMLRRELVRPWLGWLGFVMALIGLITGVSAFYTTGVFATVSMFVTGLAFALWIGAFSVVMLIRPEVDRVPSSGTVFAH